MKQYYVYIMTNHSGTLYVGVTNDLRRRVWEHKQKFIEGFTKRYNITRLVYLRRDSRCKLCDCAGETDQGLASQEEDRVD